MTIDIAAWDRRLARADTFSCGEASIDRWWREQAGQAERRGSVRLRLAVVDRRVAGFCALTVREVDPAAVGERWRGRPQHVPAVLVARLGVAASLHGLGIGRALIADALRRAGQASAEVGGELVVVDAKNPDVVDFYLRLGFHRSISAPQTLWRGLKPTHALVDAR